MIITIKQLNWCNSFVGHASKNWNNYMSIFVLGSKLNVMFFKVSFTKLILNKIFTILNFLVNKKKKVLFIIPELVWVKSFLIPNVLSTKTKVNYSFDLKNLFTISFINWIYGTLTNYKNIFKYKNIVSYQSMPTIAFILTSTFNNNSYCDVGGIANECFRTGLITFGLCSSNQSPFFFDYAIPSNSKSFEVSLFYYRIFLSFFYLNSIKMYSKFYLNLLKKNFIF